MHARMNSLVHYRRRNRCGRDVTSRQKRQLSHTRTLGGNVRTTTWKPNYKYLLQIPAQMRQSPGLITLDQAERIVESFENVGRGNIRPTVLYDDIYPPQLRVGASLKKVEIDSTSLAVKDNSELPGWWRRA
jgi:hypothetical protein